MRMDRKVSLQGLSHAMWAILVTAATALVVLRVAIDCYDLGISIVAVGILYALGALLAIGSTFYLVERVWEWNPSFTIGGKKESKPKIPVARVNKG